MSATRIQLSAASVRGRALAGPLLVLALSIVATALSRRAVTHVASWHLQTAAWSERASFLVVGAAFVGAVLFRSIQYRDFSRPLSICARWIGAIVFVQVLFDAFGPEAGPPNILLGANEHVLFFRYAALLAVVAGLGALWRPSFLIPLFYYYVSWRELIGKVIGIPVVPTDYLGMLDAGYFCVIGGILTICLTAPWTMRRFRSISLQVARAGGPEAFRFNTFGLVWACAVGAHLGSYFWSGLTKVEVGGDAPWTWMFQNPTQTAILIGLERGDNPLAAWPAAVQMLWDGIIAIQPLMNIFVLGTQLLSPLAAISPPVLSVFCLLFDIFHVGVYFTLGALFFFWIAVNLVIVAAASRMPRDGFTPAMRVVMVLTVFFGHYAFYTNYLGWLDAAKLASPQFYARTADGRKVLVPSNYFGIFSYTIAQTSLFVPDDHFEILVGGNSVDRTTWQDALACGPAIVAHQDTHVDLAAVQNLVLETDRLMRANPVLKERNLYYLYPHHMLPNPWVFPEFNELRIDDIVGYDYIVDSVCLSLQDGKLVRDVRKRSTFKIDLP